MSDKAGSKAAQAHPTAKAGHDDWESVLDCFPRSKHQYVEVELAMKGKALARLQESDTKLHR